MRVNLRSGWLDLESGMFHGPEGPIPLTPIERKALHVLAERAPDPVTTRELLLQAWGVRATRTRAVAVAMTRLRKKLDHDHHPSIRTVRGVGYALLVDTPTEPADRRDDLRRDIDRHHRAGRPWIRLVGWPGIGRRTLARGWASTNPSACWIDGALPNALAVLDALDGTRVPHRCVLDHPESLPAADLQRVRNLCDRGDLQVVAIGGGHSHADATLALHPLPPDAALSLFHDERASIGTRDLDPERLTWLNRLGGHPAALLRAAQTIDLLREPDALWSTGEPHSLHQLFERHLHRLSDTAKGVLDHMAYFEGTVDIRWIQELTAHDASAITAALTELWNAGAVHRDASGVSVHRFVSTWVRWKNGENTHWLEWLASTHRDPALLVRLRPELQRVVHQSPWPLRRRLLVRLIEVLYHFGPADSILPTTNDCIPVGSSGDLMLALAYGTLFDVRGLDDCLRRLDHDALGTEERVIAASLSQVAALWRRDPDDAARHGAAVLEGLDHLTDPADRIDVQLHLLESLPRDGPELRRRCVSIADEAGERFPGRRVAAMFRSARSQAISRPVLDRLSHVLDRGRNSLGRQRWWAYRTQLACLALELEPDEAHLYDFLTAIREFQALSSTGAPKFACVAAVAFLDRPALAERCLVHAAEHPLRNLILALQNGDHEAVRRLEPRPVREVGCAFIDGDPIPAPHSWTGRALRALRARRTETD